MHKKKRKLSSQIASRLLKVGQLLFRKHEKRRTIAAVRDLVEAVCVVVLEQLQESTNSRLGLPAYTIMTVSPIGNSICVAFRQQNIDPNRIFVWVIEFPPMPQNLWSAEAIITENFLEDMLELTFRTWREQKKLFFLG